MQVDEFKDSPIGRLVPISGKDPRTQRQFDHYAFVPAPLPRQVDLCPGTYKVLSEAERYLGILDARVGQLPNPNLLVRPSLTREAVSTSALEGTYAPYAEVLDSQYFDNKDVSAEVREVRNFVSAAFRGLKLIETLPICLRVISELQEILVKRTRGDAYDAGQLRERQVRIGDRGIGIEQSRFVPPPPGDILRDGVFDWERWVNSEQDIPILEKVALSHYQFETLHPFSDGNGRIGRLTITLQLIEENLLHHPVLNLSPWLEPRREDYVDHLLRVSQTGNFDPWVRFFGEAVKAQAQESTETIDRLNDFSTEVLSALRDIGERTGSVTLALASDLIGYPRTTVSRVADDLEVSYPAANSAVGKLVNLGYLREITGGNYGRIFQCDRVYELLANR